MERPWIFPLARTSLPAARPQAIALAWAVSCRLRLPPPKTGAFIQGAFRGNGAFIALPVIVYSLGALDPRAETLGTVVLAPVVVLFNVLGVLVLTRYNSNGKQPGKSSRVFNPHPLSGVLNTATPALARRRMD